MARMSHFYPNVLWPMLTLKQLEGYLLRIPELYQREMTAIELMQAKDVRQFRIENDI